MIYIGLSALYIVPLIINIIWLATINWNKINILGDILFPTDKDIDALLEDWCFIWIPILNLLALVAFFMIVIVWLITSKTPLPLIVNKILSIKIKK